MSKTGKKGRVTRPHVEAELEKIEKATVKATSPKKPEMAVTVIDTTVKELAAREADVFRKEWVFDSEGMAPQTWLREKKGMSDIRAETIVSSGGGSAAWYREKEATWNAITKGMVKKHVDLVVEVQETHIQGSKLTLAKAMDMLANGPEYFDKTTGEKKRGQLRSIDLLNCATALEKAQKIYRTAMGLGNDESGLKQILETLQRSGLTQINIQNNTTINEAAKEPDLPPEEQAMRDKMQKMSYEDLVEIIEWRREQKKKREEEAKAQKEKK